MKTVNDRDLIKWSPVFTAEAYDKRFFSVQVYGIVYPPFVCSKSLSVLFLIMITIRTSVHHFNCSCLGVREYQVAQLDGSNQSIVKYLHNTLGVCSQITAHA